MPGDHGSCNVVGAQLPTETIAAIDNWRKELETKLHLRDRPSRSIVLKSLTIVGLRHIKEAEEAVRREYS